MRSLIKNFSEALALALVVMCGTAGSSSASVMTINTGGVQVHYLAGGGPRICDDASCNDGAGNSVGADTLSAVTFFLNDIPVRTLTSDIFADYRFNLSGQLPSTSTIGNVTGGYFNLLTNANNPGWGLALVITGGDTTVVGNSLTVAAKAVLCPIATCNPNENLPIYGNSVPPYDVILTFFKSQIVQPTNGVFSTDITYAQGVGIIQSEFVPEPGPLALIGIGLLSLLGFRMAGTRAA